MRWYYEKKELRNCPSVQSGMDHEMEGRYRREGARFIIDIGSSMNLSLTTMATGVVYFHRFYMFHTFQEFTRYPTALACLFLAGKVEETPKKCKDMLKYARDLIPERYAAVFSGDIHQRSEEVMTLERIILQTIKFDLHVEHPYTFLLKYAKCLKGDKARLQKMVQMAWTFVNDSLCTTLCLQWEPEIVAIALMHLAGKLSKFEVENWIGRTSEHYRWWDMFVDDMTIELLEDICHQVLDLYSQTTPVAGESPPTASPSPAKPPLPSSPASISSISSTPLPSPVGTPMKITTVTSTTAYVQASHGSQVYGIPLSNPVGFPPGLPPAAFYHQQQLQQQHPQPPPPPLPPMAAAGSNGVAVRSGVQPLIPPPLPSSAPLPPLPQQYYTPPPPLPPS